MNWTNPTESGISETIVATDLAYTFRTPKGFGFGIRIEGAGLVKLTPPVYDTREEAAESPQPLLTTLTYDETVAMLEALPERFQGAGGTPIWME